MATFVAVYNPMADFCEHRHKPSDCLIELNYFCYWLRDCQLFLER